MDFLEKICFEIISNSGDGKSLAIEAIEAAENKDFELAYKLLIDAEEASVRANSFHMDLLSKEASGEKIEIKMLLIHAEDQLLSAQTVILLAKKMINILKKI